MYSSASTVAMITRRRWTGSYHQRAKNGRRDPATGGRGGTGGGEKGFEKAIGLQPSNVNLDLPVFWTSPTIRRHGYRRAQRTGMAGVCTTGDPRARRALRQGPGDGVLRLRSHVAVAAARQPDAADAARQSATRRASTDRADGRRHRSDRRSLREIERTPIALQ